MTVAEADRTKNGTGDGVVSKNLDEISRRVDDLEASLRKSGKDIDARKLRSDFEAWLREVEAKWQDDEETTAPPPATATVR